MTVRPLGLAARFALLLALALVVANLVALSVLALQRERFDARATGDRDLARSLGLVPVFEAAPAALWPEILRRARRHGADLTLGPQPLADPPAADTAASGLTRRLSDALDGRAVQVARAGPDSLAISVAVQGPDGPVWLNLRTTEADDGEDPAPGLALGLILLVSLVAVLAVGLIFLRGLTRPLRALERAAEAAGAGDRSARVPVRGAREVQAVATAFNAMQERIAAFEAERLRMVGAVGHDLRTPITSLRLRAEMLDDDAERDPMVATLDEMAVMADGLVAYARGGTEAEAAGPLPLRPLLARLAAERGAELAPGAEATVRGRPVALGRAVGNIVDNALRYGGAARIALTVEGSMAVVRIADDGPGLPDALLATVFDPFVRGEDSRSAETGGAGLGLSIARQIVTAHGGAIALENTVPRGLCAVIRLPLA